MAWGLHLLIDAQGSTEEFVKQLEGLLGISLRRDADVYGPYFEFEDDQVCMRLREDHGFVNDRQLRFEDYRYDLGLWPHRDRREEEREKWRKELAPALFEKLKATNRYALMLTEGVEIKLDEFHPEGNRQVKRSRAKAGA